MGAWVVPFERLDACGTVCAWEHSCWRCGLALVCALGVPLLRLGTLVLASCRCCVPVAAWAPVPLESTAAVCSWGLGFCRVALLCALGSSGAACELAAARWRHLAAASCASVLRCCAATKSFCCLGVYAGVIFFLAELSFPRQRRRRVLTSKNKSSLSRAGIGAGAVNWLCMLSRQGVAGCARCRNMVSQVLGAGAGAASWRAYF